MSRLRHVGSHRWFQPAGPARGPSHKAAHLKQRRITVPWALIAVLTVQAILSLRLIHQNTAFQDEALYLWAGHLEFAHWLHGTDIPAFPTYFSGAPVLYPPLGALADTIGGLAGARVLSLIFMLVSTVGLWRTVCDLFTPRAAFFACALFGLAGATLRLGAFATFDAMSLCLLALSALCAVRGGLTDKSSGWLVSAVVMLVLANASKYASTLFDPIVIGLLVTSALRKFGWRHSVTRGATMLAYWVGAIMFCIAFGGKEYVQGIDQTTLTRAPGSSSVSAVLGESWHLTAPVVILAVIGALVTVTGHVSLADRLGIFVAATSVFLAPLQQARIHTVTSLDKHVDFGMWFAAIAAGYAVDQTLSHIPSLRQEWVATAVCVAALSGVASFGDAEAMTLFHSWPNSTNLVRAAGKLLRTVNGPILAEHPSILEYYTPEGGAWERWSSTRTIRLTDGRSLSAGVGKGIDANIYLKLVQRHYFSAIVLDFGPTASLDKRLVVAMRKDGEYRLGAVVTYGTRRAVIWLSAFGKSGSNLVYKPPAGETAVRAFLTPVTHPSRILGYITIAIEISGALCLAFIVVVRYAWRRGKGSADL